MHEPKFKTGERVLYLGKPAVVRDAPQDVTDEYYIVQFPNRPDGMVHVSEVDTLLQPFVDGLVSSEATLMAEELYKIIERLEEIGDTWAVEHGFRAVEHKIEEAVGPLVSAAEAAYQYAIGILTPKDD